MIDAFWSAMADYRLSRWIMTAVLPAVAFWLGGLAMLLSWYDWSYLEQQMSAWSVTEWSVIWFVVTLGIAASIGLIHLMQPVVISLIQGRWPAWMAPLSRWMADRWYMKSNKVNSDLQSLWKSNAAKTYYTMETGGYQRLLRYLHCLPKQKRNFAPTYYGNVINAAIERPLNKYGLHVGICWPRLWILLPESTQSDLSCARTNLDASVRIWCWSLLFIVWGIQVWWLGLLGIISAVLVYHLRVIPVAETYGDLIESTFDVYRNRLYVALRWPLPKNPKDELTMGQRLTDFLAIGSDFDSPVYENNQDIQEKDGDSYERTRNQ